MLAALNRVLCRWPVADSAPVRAKLIEALEATRGGQTLLATRAAAEAFPARFEESNERLRRRHFAACDCLFAADFYRHAAQAFAALAVDVAQMAEIVADILRFVVAGPAHAVREKRGGTEKAARAESRQAKFPAAPPTGRSRARL